MLKIFFASGLSKLQAFGETVGRFAHARQWVIGLIFHPAKWYAPLFCCWWLLLPVEEIWRFTSTTRLSTAATWSTPPPTIQVNHRLNMEVDLQSFFGSMSRDVHSCTHWLGAETPQLPPSPRVWTRITRALLVSKDRRHLFVTPWGLPFHHILVSEISVSLTRIQRFTLSYNRRRLRTYSYILK